MLGYSVYPYRGYTWSPDRAGCAMTRPLDPALEQALTDTRRRAEWLRTGRVTLELHLLAGMVVEHHVDTERTTEREVERMMQERPRKQRSRWSSW